MSLTPYPIEPTWDWVMAYIVDQQLVSPRVYNRLTGQNLWAKVSNNRIRDKGVIIPLADVPDTVIIVTCIDLNTIKVYQLAKDRHDVVSKTFLPQDLAKRLIGLYIGDPTAIL